MCFVFVGDTTFFELIQLVPPGVLFFYLSQGYSVLHNMLDFSLQWRYIWNTAQLFLEHWRKTRLMRPGDITVIVFVCRGGNLGYPWGKHPWLSVPRAVCAVQIPLSAERAPDEEIHHLSCESLSKSGLVMSVVYLKSSLCFDTFPEGHKTALTNWSTGHVTFLWEWRSVLPSGNLSQSGALHHHHYRGMWRERAAACCVLGKTGISLSCYFICH